VLIALDDPTKQRVAAILADCELRGVASCAELVGALEQDDHDLIVVAAHCDASSAATLLERLFRREDSPPVLWVRGTSFTGERGRPTVEVMRRASEQLGAQYFIDLTDYADHDAGNARVRRMVERLFIR
jgi:hypothetical protein